MKHLCKTAWTGKIMKRRIFSPLITENLKLAISMFRKTKAKFWKALAEKISLPKRRRIKINVSKIGRLTVEGETVVVPGKVLGGGKINHPVTVAAVSFSSKALEKIRKAGGECISLNELAKRNPKGSRVKILR